MRRFIGSNAVTYDANILVYYCFLDGNIKILELTTKARKMTQFLINSDLKVVVPDFIVNEIKRKSIAEIVVEYLDDPTNMSRLIGLPKKPRHSLRLRLQYKVEKNFSTLEDKSWFNIEKYDPSESELENIQLFFLNMVGTKKMDTLLSLKQRSDACLSIEDQSLILFSNTKKLSLISNDRDIICFSDELMIEGLTHSIIPLKDIKLT